MSVKHPTYNKSAIRLTVPCGKCYACLESRRTEWSIRLKEEAKDHIHMQFITLTYDDENLTYGEEFPTLVKSDLQNWFKRLRRQIEPYKIRYYAVGEYGTKTFRPHYHILLFGLPLDKIHDGILEKTWRYGIVHVGEVNMATIHYVTKYHVNKNLNVYGSEPSFALMSRKPAIGASYLKRMQHYHDGKLDKDYYQHSKYRSALPRYYREKLYSKEEREHINEEMKKIMYEKEQQDIAEHYETNDKNYYEYQVEKIDRNIKNHRIKLNEKNLF